MRNRQIVKALLAYVLIASRCALASAGGAQESTHAVAVVCALAGQPMVVPPAEERRALGLFDWLPEGAVIEATADSKLTLALRNGRRYELSGSARAAVGVEELTSVSGNVRSLAPLPPWPQIAGIRADEKPGRRAGAVRIRGEQIPIRYPGDGFSVLADRAVLEFRVVDGAHRYRVEIQNEAGKAIFQVETQAAKVHVSPGVLQRGSSYYWTVRSLDRQGAVARGESSFSTLSTEAEEARETLLASVEKAGDAASFALMAEIDRGLGLLGEARDGLRTALQKSPAEPQLAEALAALERRLVAGERVE